MALAGSSEVSGGTREAATRGVAWRDRAESTPCRPREQPDILFEPLLPCQALCPRPGASNGLGCITAVVLTEPSSRSCLLLEGHIPSGPHLLSANNDLLSPNGEVSCPPLVVGVCSSLQGCDPVFLHQKVKLNSRAIVFPALLWL